MRPIAGSRTPGDVARGLVALLAAAVTATLALSGLAGCRPAAQEPSGVDLGNLADVAPAPDPRPAASDALDLVAFVSADSRQIYLWSTTEEPLASAPEALTVKVRPIYSVDQSWSVKTMAFSPDARQPYLALTEAFDQGTGLATRLTVINTSTGEFRRVLPNPGFSPQISSLQWSADGRRLFANGRPPLVLDLASGGDDIVWDLTPIVRDQKTEPRRPLLSPDFKAVAFTRFYLSGEEDEDLWLLREDEGSPGRITTGNQGAYPIAWLGGAADGSQPDGPYDYLLVQIGSIGTGGGLERGLAVVNLRTKERTDWEAPYATIYGGPADLRAPVVDLPGRRVLLNALNAMTGQEARVYWRSLADGTLTELPDLAGLVIGSAAGARGGASGGAGTGDAGTGSVLAAVVAGEKPVDGDRCEVWAIDSRGACSRLATAGADVTYTVVDKAGDWYVVLQAGPGSSQPGQSGASLLATDGPGQGLRTVVFKADPAGAAGGD